MMARLFVLTALVYPVALALLCLGAGLLIDRCSGCFLPAALLPSVGAAALIALTQLTTYISPLAPATPYLMAAFAIAGFALARTRVLALPQRLRTLPWLPAVALLVYLAALAPVLLAGRASFSSFMALSDSAVHLIGADFLIHHGQDYSHLDLRNSYGQFIEHYYNTSYPSGSDTLFGGSALLLGLPLIWTFQPFNAVMLALACGPAWVLARKLGVRGPLTAVAVFTATVPALVYGYELIGSIKEITALSMILTLGALVVAHRDWLWRAPARAIPFALVLAGGVSALGAGFGAWALTAAAVLLVIALADLRAGRHGVRPLLARIVVGAIVVLVAAWPTWINISGSLHVAQTIAATSNAGNLHAPLKWTQVFGVWLRGSYKQPPSGSALVLTDVLIAVALAACAIGALTLVRTRRLALAGWLALMLLLWLLLHRYATTWADAKSLMLTSSVVVLLAWGGFAALIGSPARRARRSALRIAAMLLALAFTGGVLVSDAAQYHSSNLAPTARYEELASLGDRFAGRGPALFTDFDEYSMYVLRKLDVGGPDFVYPPPALADIARGYGYPLELDRASPAALLAYPLIITRRDPSAAPPPAAYRLAWQGRYYEAWVRRSGAPAAILHAPASSERPLKCARVQRLARLAAANHARLIGALAPELVRVSLAGASHPRRWGHQRQGLVMSRPGSLSAGFIVPRAGAWELWLQGQFMPAVRVDVDGRALARISGQLAGNSLVPDTTPPAPVRLSAGRHRVSVTRTGFSLAPGNGGSAVLDSIFLTPAGAPARTILQLSPGAGSRALCGHAYDWIEIVSA